LRCNKKPLDEISAAIVGGGYLEILKIDSPKRDTLFAIEVKSSQSIKKEAFRHITDFQHKSKLQVVGIVIYSGDEFIPFGVSTISAMPCL